MGRLGEAVGCHRAALAIARETGDRDGEESALNNLGNAYLQLGQSADAVGCYRAALVITREFGDRYQEGEVLRNLGTAYWESHQPEQAAACWQEAADAMREAGSEEQAAYLDRSAVRARHRRGRWRRWRHRPTKEV
jgi:tetratricopeptide (TPR) repeat protein